MKQPSQEDLLGFVLGALEAQEHEHLQQLIESNPALETRLHEIKAALRPLDYVDGEMDDRGNAARRPGLARRTCEMVSAYQKQADLERDKQLDLAIEANLLEQLNPSPITPAPITPAPPLAATTVTDSKLESNTKGTPLRSWLGRSTSPSSWSLTDLIVGIAVCAVLAGILLPALSYSRYNSRLVACQGNLASLGSALFEYSDSHDGRFVEIPESGNLSVSGCFGPILKDLGLLENDNLLRCQGRSDESPLHIPTCQQIEQANGAELEALRRQMGGDYGYTLGYDDGNQICVPRSQHRSNMVLLSDMPSNALAGRQSKNHRGNGQNCLFENGGVRFITTPAIGEDSIFENDYGIVAPGSHVNDNVIAPSYITPMTSMR